jgi:glycogen synthase
VKVLMLSWEYPPHNVGGLGKHVQELVPALAEESVEVHVLTPRWNAGETEQIIQENPRDEGESTARTVIYRVDGPEVDPTDYFTSASRINLALEEKGQTLIEKASTSRPYDLMHCHDWLTAFAAIGLKHTNKIPLIATIHATEKGRSRGSLHGESQRAIHSVEWRLAYEAWRIICASRYMATEVEETFGAPADKVDIIANGVDCHKFDSLDGVDLAAFRRKYAESDEKIVFYVGRVVFEKGVHVLVDSMRRVLARHPRVKLIVAGTGNHLLSIRRQVAELELGNRVQVTGFLPDEDRDRLFKVADVAVFPSLYEPFGIVALEAMAARVPVVVTDVGGLREVIRPHETGLIARPDDPDSLAWAINHTFDHPEWARMRAENAYRAVNEEFNWHSIAQATRRVYERVKAERVRVNW